METPKFHQHTLNTSRPTASPQPTSWGSCANADSGLAGLPWTLQLCISKQLPGMQVVQVGSLHFQWQGSEKYMLAKYKFSTVVAVTDTRMTLCWKSDLEKISRICWELLFLIFFLNWSIVDLQCCVNFCCTATWVSYIYIFLKIFFSIVVYHRIFNIVYTCAKLLQLCPTLCNPMECSLPDSSILGIFQARILEWVAIFYCRGSSWPRDGTCVSYVSCIGR